ncbi:MAG: hypothetical protein H6841_01265 [Planctomycetes bacterium]|nr:hypothetical protein [Planctomycetota bacterium]
MKKRIGFLALIAVALALAAGCRDAGEFMAFTGAPEGADGWGETYEASPADVWEAFRLVARDNGTIKDEDPDEMTLRGEYKPHDSSEWDGIAIKGQVYDKGEGEKLASRLIVHAWYSRNANDRERPEVAREYCNSVFRVLKAWKGEVVDEDPTVTTTSEDPVKEDEAIGFFKVKPEQAFAVCKTVIGKYGAVEQADDKSFYIRGVKTNALESTKDDVRVNVYDRTEDAGARCKVSVRVRAGEDNAALQEIARSYVAEIRKELEKQFGAQD